MNRREFLSTAVGVAGAGFFPRLIDAGPDQPIRLAHLGAHEGRFTPGALTLVSGYSVEGHHLAGQAIVELIRGHVSGAKAAVLTVVATAADALRLLRAGRTDTPYGQFTVDLALVEGDEADAALHGTNGSGPQNPGELRLLWVLPPQVLHLVTLRGSPIGSVSELKGKTVSLGPPRSRSEKVMLRLLEAFDPSLGASLRREALGLSASMWALAEKKIDAFAWHGPVSTALFEHLTGLLGGIRMTLLSHEEGIAKLRAKYGPAYYTAVIQQGTYPWLEKDVRVVGTRNFLISRADFPAQQAYDIVKTLSSHPNAVAGGERRLSDGNDGPEAPLPLPLHPSALRFREETK